MSYGYDDYLIDDVRQCAESARNEVDFLHRLRNAGITYRPVWDQDHSRVINYAVRLNDSAWVNTSHLPPDLSLTSLREMWQQTPNDEYDAQAQWDASRRPRVSEPDAIQQRQQQQSGSGSNTGLYATLGVVAVIAALIVLAMFMHHDGGSSNSPKTPGASTSTSAPSSPSSLSTSSSTSSSTTSDTPSTSTTTDTTTITQTPSSTSSETPSSTSSSSSSHSETPSSTQAPSSTSSNRQE